MSPIKGNPAAARSCSPPFHGSAGNSRIKLHPLRARLEWARGVCTWPDPEAILVSRQGRLLRCSCRASLWPAGLSLSSGPEDFHLRALPEPYVNLSIHTAPIVRPLPWHSDQWARSLGFARRNRSNQSLAPLVWWRIRLNLRRAHLMT